MITVYSPTIRRKEMDAVLTCMVEEKIGPAFMNEKLCTLIKETLHLFGGVLALRSPDFALSLALKALGIQQGAGVALSAFAPFWQYDAIKQAGFSPVVMDVDSKTAGLSMQAVQDAIKRGAGAVIVAHTFGILPNLQDIKDIAVPIIEDITQSFGATYSSFASRTSSVLDVSEEQQLEGMQQTNINNDIDDNINDNTDKDKNKSEKSQGTKAGTVGAFAIMGLEENDIITAGGGALLFAADKKMSSFIKKMAESVSQTQVLPDINCSLAYVGIKEYQRNEALRKTYFALFMQSLKMGRHSTFIRPEGEYSSVYNFAVVLNCGAKDVIKQATKKDVQVINAFENTVIANLTQELKPICPVAYSLFLRTVVFPLYPLLGQTNANIVAKLIGNLP